MPERGVGPGTHDQTGRTVRRMTETEFVMWTLDADPALRSDFVNITLLDSAPDEERLRAKMAGALRDVPHFADRVVTTPLRLAPPEWHPEREIDLDYHFRKISVPAPGTLRDLLDLTAVVAATPFDRTRPLWEFTLVEGRRDGKVALLEKVHHAVTDGVGRHGSGGSCSVVWLTPPAMRNEERRSARRSAASRDAPPSTWISQVRAPASVRVHELRRPWRWRMRTVPSRASASGGCPSHATW